jgi:hypothetical protein
MTRAEREALAAIILVSTETHARGNPAALARAIVGDIERGGLRVTRPDAIPIRKYPALRCRDAGRRDRDRSRAYGLRNLTVGAQVDDIGPHDHIAHQFDRLVRNAVGRGE